MVVRYKDCCAVFLCCIIFSLLIWTTVVRNKACESMFLNSNCTVIKKPLIINDASCNLIYFELLVPTNKTFNVRTKNCVSTEYAFEINSKEVPFNISCYLRHCNETRFNDEWEKWKLT